ncbi:hypothetical protein V6N13_135288 [Hibiscus sabdariffa]
MKRPPLAEQPTCRRRPSYHRSSQIVQENRSTISSIHTSPVDFRRRGGGGNDRDGPTTDVVGGIVTIVGGIGPNRNLGFGELWILDFGVVL